MIYTAICGGIDKKRSDIKCFTDSTLFIDPCRDAKKYKVLSHLYMPGDYSIWIDGNIRAIEASEKIIELLGDAEIAVFPHPARNCVYQELAACIRLNKDDIDIMTSHVNRYKKEDYPENAGMSDCGIILRKHTQNIIDFNNAWWAEITRGSKRDQLSFMYLINKYEINIKFIKGSIKTHPYFERHKHKKMRWYSKYGQFFKSFYSAIIL